MLDYDFAGHYTKFMVSLNWRYASLLVYLYLLFISWADAAELPAIKANTAQAQTEAARLGSCQSTMAPDSCSEDEITSERFKRLYKRWLKVPEDQTGEIIQGKLYVHPRPISKYADAQLGLSSVLHFAYRLGIRGPGGWIIQTEPNLRLRNKKQDPDLVHPDIAGWKIGNLPEGETLSTPFIDVVPDWVCEVDAPSTRSYDRKIKNLMYARHGVSHLWSVDAESKLLEVLKLEGGKWLQLQTFTQSESVRAEPFESISFPLRHVWPKRAPGPVSGRSRP